MPYPHPTLTFDELDQTGFSPISQRRSHYDTLVTITAKGQVAVITDNPIELLSTETLPTRHLATEPLVRLHLNTSLVSSLPVANGNTKSIRRL
jgi:hypothetical protein